MQIRQKQAAHCGVWIAQKYPPRSSPAPLGLCTGESGKGKFSFSKSFVEQWKKKKKSLLGKGLEALIHQIPSLEGPGCQRCTKRSCRAEQAVLVLPQEIICSCTQSLPLPCCFHQPLLSLFAFQRNLRKKWGDFIFFFFFFPLNYLFKFLCSWGGNPALCAERAQCNLQC